MLRLADFLLSKLNSLGIKHLFYVPGGQCVFLCDALRRSETIKGISMHHEQAVAMAAVAYSTINEKLGAGLVTTGCAGTNTLTGVLHAFQDSIPLIIISGQQNYENTVKASGIPIRQIGIQEADIETLVKPITKYAVTVSEPSEIRYHFEKAVYLATHGRKGPVWLDVPLNVQNTMIDENNLKGFTDYEESNKPTADALDQLKQAYADAKKSEVIGTSADAASADTINGAKAYADSLVVGGVIYKGEVNGTDKLLPTTGYKAGWEYSVAVAGTYAGKVCQAGDFLIANKDYASGAVAADDWNIKQGTVAVTDDNASLVIGTPTEVAVVEGVAIHVTQVEDTTKLECAAVADTTDYPDVTSLFTAPAGE